MKKFFLIFFFILLGNKASADVKEKIIKNLTNTNNISFDFEQIINGNTENGNCVIQYPKKIYCSYDIVNNKILVSNGKSLVIKTKTSYYLYSLEKTPLNYILNKDYLINKIKNLNEENIEKSFIIYTFFENENEVNIFFDEKNYTFAGWQTTDIYQNLSTTYLSSIIKNQDLNEKIFILPNQN